MLVCMTRQIRFNAFDMNCVAHQSSVLDEPAPGVMAMQASRGKKRKQFDGSG